MLLVFANSSRLIFDVGPPWLFKDRLNFFFKFLGGFLSSLNIKIQSSMNDYVNIECT